jgi:ribonuclease J
MIEICAVGGHSIIGRNMTAVKYKEEVIILDMGIHLDNYIRYTEDDDVEIEKLSADELISVGAIPDISIIKNWRSMVKAIVPTHAHLDHLGAIPFLANSFDCPVICSAYSGSVLKEILKDNKITIKNKILTMNNNGTHQISKNIKIEFINVTHSTPDTVMIAVHTPDGIVLYCNDFKFDNAPTLGDKPNFDRLKKLKNVNVLVIDSLYADRKGKTPSEAVARELLKDVMLGINAKKNAIIVSTFSSHLARLKSIISFGHKLNRKIIFLGRSLAKYVYAGEDIKLVNFSKDVEIVKYSSKVKKRLKRIEKDGRHKYLLVVTGHQAEPNSVLSKMVYQKYFDFRRDDVVIFSCTIIPDEINKLNREKLESEMESDGVRIFRDVHVSGHASREDHRDLINMVKPKNIIPAHADVPKCTCMKNLCLEMGYKDKNIFIMKEGDFLKFE